MKTTNTKEKSAVPRILIIDDDDEFIGILRITLEKVGYDVYTAGNGTEGLKLLVEHSVDLVVTDIFMPEMEGIETILKLRREFPGLKIIAVSGGGDLGPESYLDAAKLLGAHTPLTKPLVMTEFLATVREILGLESESNELA